MFLIWILKRVQEYKFLVLVCNTYLYMFSHGIFMQEMKNDAVEDLKSVLHMRDNTVSNIYL